MKLLYLLSSQGVIAALLSTSFCIANAAQWKDRLMMNGNKNDAKQQEKEKIPVDIDAATGTVHQRPASNKDGASCDGQLASALVQANDLISTIKVERDQALENYQSALENVKQLENVFALAERNLIEEQGAHHKMESEMTRALKVEKERSTEELKEMEAASVRTLEQVTKESDDKIRLLRTEKDEIIASLEEKINLSVEELESTLNFKLEKAEKDKQIKIAAVEADRDVTVNKLTAKMDDAIEKLKIDRDKKLTELTAVMKNAVENLERDRDSKVERLTRNIQIAADEAEKVLRTTKNDAKEQMLKQITYSKDDMAQVKVKCDNLLTDTNKKVLSLQELTEKMSNKKLSFEKSLNEANAELGHWRSLYSDRSYCNMTYIANDVYHVSARAYSQAWKTTTKVYTESRKHAAVAMKLTGEHILIGLEYSSRFMNDQVDEHWPTIQQTIQPYFKKYIADNYETHIEPHLREHLFPRFNQASVWYYDKFMPWSVRKIDDCHTFFTPILNTCFDEVEKFHFKMTGLYGEYCSSSLQEFLKISKESDVLMKYPPPTYFWKQSCLHPRESLNALMQGIFVLLSIAFRRRILGLFLGFFGLLLSIIIHLTPLRFVLLQRSDTSTTKFASTCPSSISLSASVDDTETVGSIITKIETDDES